MNNQIKEYINELLKKRDNANLLEDVSTSLLLEAMGGMIKSMREMELEISMLSDSEDDLKRKDKLSERLYSMHLDVVKNASPMAKYVSDSKKLSHISDNGTIQAKLITFDDLYSPLS